MEEELLKELQELRQRIKTLEESELRLMRIEESLRASEERYRDLFENVTDLIQCVSSDGHFVYVNRAWKKTLGYSEDEIKNLSIADIIAPECIEHCLDVFKRLMSGEVIERTEATFVAKDGREVIVEGNINAGFSNGKPVSTKGIFRDISKRKALEKDLRTLSLSDDLTGLYNRRGFLTLADQQTKTAKRLKKGLILLYADIDRMKWINDTLGHKEGDCALRDTATILRDSTRESDIVARIGGDEFVVLAIDVTNIDAETITERLRENIRIHNETAGRAFNLSISTGISRYEYGTDSYIDDMLAQADKLMYDQKRHKDTSPQY